MSNILELNVRAKPKTVEKELAADAAPFGPIELGKKYVLKNGVVITITDVVGNNAYSQCDPYNKGWEGTYFWKKDSGLFGSFEHDLTYKCHIVAEYKEVLSIDQIKELWLTGSNLYYRHKAGGTVWQVFPSAYSLSNPGMFFDGYKNTFEWKVK